MSMQLTHEVKALNTRIQKLELELETKLQEKQRAESVYVRTKEEIRNLKEKLAKLSEVSKEPIVSEHAMLRYIERICGIDLNLIKKAILTETVLNSIATFGSGKFPIKNGCHAIVKNRTIVTIE